MIQLNLNSHKKTFIDIIKNNKDDKIIIYDLRDPISLYPYTKYDLRGETDYLHQIFTLLPEEYYKNLHFLSIVYNLQDCYDLVKKTCISEKLIDKNHNDFHIHFYPWLFSDIQFHAELKEEFYNTLNLPKKYKICMLSLKKKLARMILLSYFHSNEYFVYSNIGGIDKDDELNILDEQAIPIDDVNFYDKKLNFFYDLDANVENFYFKNNKFNIQRTKRLTEDFYLLYDYHKSFSYEKKCFEESVLCNYVPIEYFESHIILNCESSCLQSSIITEKTFKNFFFKKPFITMAGPYFNKFLKKNGFELYDELFDYSHDNMNCFDRLNDIILQISSLLEEDFNYLKDIINSEDIKNKINHNHELSKNLFSLTNRYVKFETLTKLCCEMILDNHEDFKPLYFT